MAIYSIIDFEREIQFSCTDDTYILDAAEEAGVRDLPYAGRMGTDSSSAARLLSGKVDQRDGSFLNERQKAAGFFLTDTSYPLSDCVVQFSVEAELYDYE
ncbi:2Fe-2S iron-sulfur cluster-binding protein [Pectobacterium aroidearum]|uniref:2Fe-2S iron-sulfur cluster-binding protein n=1 Tax=Pectobacterium aroidearum TaxID=1201031 RepID=UPI002114E37C|nr:2Fe-2S iron-sulfur cluster-binding protein [Pectobacterium aroidearum]UUE43500.1 ferredoxin [Pectobacterium aroidearum]UUE47719.1 ferredoxin [Pectobacterium aroidearum]UUE51924.1 ferredoxin [Pectobacterium aroidearum]UUE60334.1 ferredoxin [Pectobacterium aroidearum]UUE64557.1 ferredoxin [Pectobacterium aroidearum]